MAFIDLGNQFIALQKGRRQAPDDGRHFGLVVDNKQPAHKALKAAGVTLIDGPFFATPGAIESRSSATTTFSSRKAPNVLRGMGLMHLAKNEHTKKELAEGQT